MKVFGLIGEALREVNHVDEIPSHRLEVVAIKFNAPTPNGPRAAIRFVPWFKPDNTAEGCLRFASFEVWEDDSDARKVEVLQAALANARAVMRRAWQAVTPAAA